MLKLFQLSKGMIKPITAITVLLGLCVTLARCFYNSNKIIGRYEWHFKISLSAALLTNPSEPLIVLSMSY